MKEIILASSIENALIESVADGDGIRIVIFTAGCPHGCRGCHNPNLWSLRNGTNVKFDTILHVLNEKFESGSYKGITMSGGDPMFQRFATHGFLKEFKERFPNKDVWLYTGYLYEEIKDEQALSYVDVLVDGKFEMDKKYPKVKYRGSYNQRIIRLKEKEVSK